MNLDNLNDRQKEAVLTNSSKIMVIAGAGSGKTKVLTTRFAYLIKEKNINPENILALTFTNKASKEMKERIEKATDINQKEIQAMTFHSFCVKVLRKYINQIESSYNLNFKIASADDTKKYLSDIIEENDYDVKEFQKILNIRNKNILINEKALNPIINKIIDEFNLFLKSNNILIFDDLLIYTYLLFTTKENITKKYQEQLKYIMVDEYQDTDNIQYEIIKMLACDNNLFIVGDDFQAIYSFRNANIKNIKKFQKDFPNYQLIILNQNYRSTPEILNVANFVIKNNKDQIEKDLFTNNNSGEIPSYEKSNFYCDEAKRIVFKIQELVKKGYEYKDIAILYRINNLSRNFEDELIINKIPYLIYNGTSFYERQEIKDLISFLYLIVDEYDNLSFRRIINKPKRKLGDALINKLELQAINNQGEKYSLLKECKNSENKELKLFYENIYNIKSLYLNNYFKISDIINYIISNMNYASHLTYLGSNDTNDRYANIDEFKVILKEYDENNLIESKPHTIEYIFEVLQNIQLFSKEDLKEEQNAINLMTVHASKGLEFKIVFLPALEEGIFPSKKATLEEEIEEERRLFYVGVTRAKEKLYLSSSKERVMYGSQLIEYPSRFVKESINTIAFK